MNILAKKLADIHVKDTQRGRTMAHGRIESPFMVKLEGETATRRVYEDWSQLDKRGSGDPKRWAPVPLVVVVKDVVQLLTSEHRIQLLYRCPKTYAESYDDAAELTRNVEEEIGFERLRDRRTILARDLPTDLGQRVEFFDKWGSSEFVECRSKSATKDKRYKLTGYRDIEGNAATIIEELHAVGLLPNIVDADEFEPEDND